MKTMMKRIAMFTLSACMLAGGRFPSRREVELLEIEEGQDLCTLVTCTPYGINSHRLLVRGHRIENQESAASIRVTADAMQIEPILVAPAVAAPMLLILLIWLLLSGPKNSGKKKE